MKSLIMVWLLLFIAMVAGQRVNETAPETALNTTTLYPVTNKTIVINIKPRQHMNRSEDKILEELKTQVMKEANVNIEKESNENKKVKIIPQKEVKVTTWSIDANYALPKDKPEQLKNPAVDFDKKAKESDDSKSIDSKELELSVEGPVSNNKEKEFKPSPHLGSFFDDENLNLLKFTSPQLIEKKPIRDFVSSKDLYMLSYKNPKNTYRDQIDAPYRFETDHFHTTDDWKHTLESKPTVESSVKIPAGGLYKHSNPFKEKPSEDGEDDDFGMGYNEDGRQIENPAKKRWNPWKNLLHLVTAFLPVGLIISALTPNVITLHSTDNDPDLGRLSRRGDAGFAGAAVPSISERCRRRLLCELHSDENYLRYEDQSRVTRKHCYKLRCEDPEALRAVLAWLLAHRGPHGARGTPGRPRGLYPVGLYQHRSNDYT